MRIFYDVDTQIDFMNRDGALYVPDAELIKPNLSTLTKYATEKNIPMVGSMDRHFGTEKYKHREAELQRWEGPFPDHCMDGTIGQEKIAETDVWYNEGFFDEKPKGGNNIYMTHALDNTVDRITLAKGITKITEPVSHFKRYTVGLFFEKQSYDVFTNPAISLFLDFADVKEAIVYGVATDYCVKAAVLGMQERGIQCYVVEDAIKGVAHETTKKALDEMKAAGAQFVNASQVLEDRVK